MRNPDDHVVSASEIASWHWCPESWRLDAAGYEPGNRAALSQGESHHREKAFFERFSRAALSVGVWLIAAALLVFVVAFLVRGA